MLVRGTKAKEHAMAEAFKNSIAFVGIDIGKNSFHVDCSSKPLVSYQINRQLSG
jgi:hypothetical protein